MFTINKKKKLNLLASGDIILLNNKFNEGKARTIVEKLWRPQLTKKYF